MQDNTRRRRVGRTKATTPVPNATMNEVVYGNKPEPSTPYVTAVSVYGDLENICRRLRSDHAAIAAVLGTNHSASIALWHAFEQAQIAKERVNIVLPRMPGAI